jgi:hypothetical protein
MIRRVVWFFMSSGLALLISGCGNSESPAESDEPVPAEDSQPESSPPVTPD